MGRPDPPVRAELRRLLLQWLSLLLLGALEVAASSLPVSRSLRPLVMIPAALMIGVVLVGFMEIRRGSVLVRAFAVAAALWLLILLALGSVDPLTRAPHRISMPAARNAVRKEDFRSLVRHDRREYFFDAVLEHAAEFRLGRQHDHEVFRVL
jgi:hypothetical protein